MFHVQPLVERVILGMVIPLDGPSGAAVRRVKARNETRRRVRAMLAGSGLRIREYDHELVITNPRHPEKGRIHVEYGDGAVSLVQTVWSFWGNLQGYETEDDGPGDGISVNQILDALCGSEREVSGSPQDPGGATACHTGMMSTAPVRSRADWPLASGQVM